MVKIIHNNPFPTIDVVPEKIDLSSCKKAVEELISKMDFEKVKKKSHDVLSLTVKSKKASRRFKVTRDGQGQFTAGLNVKARKDIQKQIKRNNGALEKYILNEVYKRCVDKIEAFRKEHAAKALNKALKKH